MPAELRQNRDRDAPDPADRAGDEDRTVRRLQPMTFQRQDAEHRGVAGGADRHGAIH